MINEKEEQNVTKDLNYLKAENNRLNNLVAKILKDNEDFNSHRVYENARKKLLLFIGIY